MLGMAGMGLTAVGMWLAITPPRLAEWTDDEMVRRNKVRRKVYYCGIALVFGGTLMQMWDAWARM